MSVDGGKTWTKMGVKAEGKDGDSMFESVDTASNPGFAVFTLADGGKIEIPMQSALSIAISAKNGIFVYDEKQTFTIESKGVERMTWTKPDGWKVSVEGNALTVVAPAKANSYAETEGVIALIGMAGNFSCMAELQVSAADTHSYTVTFEGSDWAKWVACNYAPGKYSTTQLGSPTIMSGSMKPRSSLPAVLRASSTDGDTLGSYVPIIPIRWIRVNTADIYTICTCIIPMERRTA